MHTEEPVSSSEEYEPGSSPSPDPLPTSLETLATEEATAAFAFEANPRNMFFTNSNPSQFETRVDELWNLANLAEVCGNSQNDACSKYHGKLTVGCGIHKLHVDMLGESSVVSVHDVSGYA